MRRLSIPAGKFTRKTLEKLTNLKNLTKDNNVSKNLTFWLARNIKERRREVEQLGKNRREEALSDAEGVTYEAGGFWLVGVTSLLDIVAKLPLEP